MVKIIGMTCPVGGCKKAKTCAFRGTELEYIQENVKRHLIGAQEHMMGEDEANRYAQTSHYEEWEVAPECADDQGHCGDDSRQHGGGGGGNQGDGGDNGRRRRRSRSSTRRKPRLSTDQVMAIRTSIERAHRAAVHSQHLAATMATAFETEQLVMRQSLHVLDETLHEMRSR